MSDTSKSLPIRGDKPADEIVVAVVKSILNASDKAGVPVMLVGARARDILLQHIYGLEVRRATTDVDFAFAMESWDQFNAIKNGLLATPGFVDSTGSTQRILFKAPGELHPVAVDLIPFGDIANNEKYIAWPPDMHVVMSVAGYDDAMRSALQVQIALEVTIAVACCR